MEEKISVIVPVYNVERYMDRCLNSIVSQTYRNLEILLIDDGSTDCGGEKCDQWKKKDDRIQVIHQKNSGLYAARNRGLDSATGKYIIFVDSDDYVANELIEELYYVLKEEKARNGVL